MAPSGEPHGAGGETMTTNQRMEIHAVLDALRTLEGELVIVTKGELSGVTGGTNSMKILRVARKA